MQSRFKAVPHAREEGFVNFRPGYMFDCELPPSNSQPWHRLELLSWKRVCVSLTDTADACVWKSPKVVVYSFSRKQHVALYMAC